MNNEPYFTFQSHNSLQNALRTFETELLERIKLYMREQGRDKITEDDVVKCTTLTLKELANG